MNEIRSFGLLGIALLAGSLACSSSGGAASEALPELAFHDFESGSTEGWRPHHPDHWAVEEAGGAKVYALKTPGGPGPVRAPGSWSVLEGLDLGTVELTGRLRSLADPANPRRDLCLIVHFQDPTHFYYVHLSATSDPLHNIIGLVDGKDRVKINLEPAGGSTARLTDQAWHRFKVTADGSTGEILAYLDDMDAPILTARDRTLTHGLAGIGSYDDTGHFDDIRLKGRLVAK